MENRKVPGIEKQRLTERMRLIIKNGTKGDCRAASPLTSNAKERAVAETSNTIPHYLYQLIFPNGKKYIGMTKYPRKRKIEHFRYSLSAFRYHGFKYLVCRAIRKYKPENIKFDILACGSYEYIQELEKSAILSFRTNNNKYGYNIRVGGQGLRYFSKKGLAKIRLPKSPEHMKKLALAAQLANRGAKRSAEFKSLCSKRAKELWANPEYRIKTMIAFKKRPKLASTSVVKCRDSKYKKYFFQLPVRKSFSAMNDCMITRSKVHA